MKKLIGLFCVVLFTLSFSIAEDEINPFDPEDSGGVDVAPPKAKKNSAEEMNPFEMEELNPGAAEKRTAMDNQQLNKLIRKYGETVEGAIGLWKFTVLDHDMICVTDERADRMRIIAAIKPMDEVSAEQLAKCMEANFDRALDARYCVSNDTLWSAFIHPLGDMTPELFKSALLQVAGAKANFGTTYSSGGLSFGGGSEPKPKNPGSSEPSA